MGCCPILSRGSSDPYERRDPRDPNPFMFNIIRVQDVSGTVWVSEIEYPNCTNYEGRKILVTSFNPNSRFSLDPHFMEGGGLIARFMPTEYGWQLALQMANFIVSKIS